MASLLKGRMKASGYLPCTELSLGLAPVAVRELMHRLGFDDRSGSLAKLTAIRTSSLVSEECLESKRDSRVNDFVHAA